MTEDIARLISPPRKEKLHESTVAQVKRLIHSEKLGVSDKLPSERELAKLFKVSRVVIREALRSLEQSGLIEIKPGPAGGPHVAYNLHKPLFDSALDLMNEGKFNLHCFLEARRAIEGVTVKLAVEKATAGDLKRLNEINRRLLDDLDKPEKLREHNSAFHISGRGYEPPQRGGRDRRESTPEAHGAVPPAAPRLAYPAVNSTYFRQRQLSMPCRVIRQAGVFRRK